MLIDRHKEVWSLARALRSGEDAILGRLRLSELASDSTLSDLLRQHATRIIEDLTTPPPPPSKRKGKF